MDFSGTREEGTVLTITAPEAAAGITASVRDGQTGLSFEGIRLETGPMDPGGLSPLDAIPVLLSAAGSDGVKETGTERQGDAELLRVSIRDPAGSPGQGAEQVLWFDRERKTLLRGECRYDGVTVVRCRFSAFAYTIPENSD